MIIFTLSTPWNFQKADKYGQVEFYAVHQIYKNLD